MAKFTNELNNYQNIPRELVFDNSLSDRARFIYCFMACKPDDWEFFLEPMAREIGYSVDTLRKYISELVVSGWLVKGEQDREKGVFGATSYTLKASNSPYRKNADTEKYRHGKNPTQHNRDNIQKEDILTNKESIIPKRNEYSEDFERAFVLYERKGSKADAYKRWQKLTKEEKELVFKHIPHYLSAHQVQYRKDFSGYLNKKYFNDVVYKNNVIIYDPNEQKPIVVEGKRESIVINGQIYR